ncbi:DnaB-like helicase C-terminal domain-containing protein [Devosia neptuniae]|uniref:DnaB-like helicase C-terminal domain-containing protein n=1 Tax=Devosia neptuniae TaxID=191302 RepID=A0ABY6CG09_9HYPH|nr:DnaB-like helicase C-terminal domain-containing protein [Devosia neptuniae]UXN69926.1 DnaB-like helicase C-terminal domain-containing protein [Devosia neptuniae]
MSDGFVAAPEQHLLGMILSGGDCRAALSMVDERHFVEPAHRIIFSLAKLAHERFSSTNLPVVAKLIEPQDANAFLSQTGIPITEYMATIAGQTVYGVGNAAQAARNVISQWGRLRIATSAEGIALAAREPSADPVEMARALGITMDEVLAEVRVGGRGKTRQTIAEATRDALAASRAARASGGITGISSGLADYDRLTGGFQKRDMTLLGARPSMGKTTMGTAVAASAAMTGAGVGFFSLEMDRPKLVTRFNSDLAHRRGIKIAYQDIINGSASDDDLAQIEQVMTEFNHLPIWIEDQSGLMISDIRVKTEAMISDAEQAGFTLDMLVVDHLGKIRPTSRYAGNRTNEIGEITDGLKEIAREYDLAVLLLSQLNRDVEKRDDKRPTLADLRDSGAIEQDADTVLFLYREAYYLQREKPTSLNRTLERDADLSACLNKAELEVAKQRNGRVQSIDLFVDMAHSAVRDAARPGYAEMHERYHG